MNELTADATVAITTHEIDASGTTVVGVALAVVNELALTADATVAHEIDASGTTVVGVTLAVAR